MSRYSPIKGYDQAVTQKVLEKHAMDKDCFVALYAETQLTREDFDHMFRFSMKHYETVRKRLNCARAFPHVYEKISKLGRSTS